MEVFIKNVLDVYEIWIEEDVTGKTITLTTESNFSAKKLLNSSAILVAKFSSTYEKALKKKEKYIKYGAIV